MSGFSMNRRDFLKVTGLLGVVGASGGLSLLKNLSFPILFTKNPARLFSLADAPAYW